MKINNKERGFALVEVIISMVILAILLYALMDGFTFAFTNVFSVGRKGTAISSAQADIEKSVARSEAISADDLEIDFNGTIIVIPGGIVETTQESGNRKSSMETFIPMVPTITINPKVRFEGFTLPVEIDVTGKETNFTSGQTTVQVLDRQGSTVLATISPTVSSNISASFELTDHLVNTYSDYIIRMITPISGAPDEVVRARLSVYQPRFVVVGESTVYVSEGGEYWFNRSSMLDFPFINALNDVTSNGNDYLAVGNNGFVLKSRDQQTWTYTFISGSGDLNGVTWSPYYARYFSVSSNGKVYHSEDGLFWTFANPGISESLSNIAVSSDGLIVAVGESGIVITSTNAGLTWSVHTVNVDYVFNDVTVFNNLSDNTIVAVGNDGVIATAAVPIGQTNISSSSWEYPYTGLTKNIYSVYNNLGFYILVGEEGLIGTTANPAGSWAIQDFGSADLHGVFAGEPSKYFAVGDNGTVLYSEDASVWNLTSLSGTHLTAVIGR